MSPLGYAFGYALGRGVLLPLLRAVVSRYGLAVVGLLALLLWWRP